MIPIVDDKKLRLSGRKFLSANGSRMKVHHNFFSRFMSISRRPLIESQASLFRYYSFHSQIWYLCNKP